MLMHVGFLSRMVIFSPAMSPFFRQAFASIIMAFLSLHAQSQEPASRSRFNFDACTSAHSNLSDSMGMSFADSTKRLVIFPTVNLNGGFENRFTTVSWLGGGVSWKPSKRWSLLAGYALAGGMLPHYQERVALSQHFIPGLGYAVQDESAHVYHTHYSFGAARFAASKHFVFECGKSKHFWGDGYRSLILSDHASPAPYFGITTTLGKLRYQNLWMQLRDISKGQPLSQSRFKYAAMHALSYDLTPRLNASLYEWVIWQNSDTLSRRGLDLYYLNPLVFYRPVEYSLGSPDNVILAGSLRWNLTESFQLYGQFVLDEFNLKLFRRGDGWWGNKIAGQAGLKWNTPAEGLNVLSEVNVARPFIYTHGSSIQAWTHVNQAMAHPLGANFMELCNRISYSHKRWRASEQLNLAAFGRDDDTNGDGVVENYGGNITRSYVNPYGGNFGHRMLQGIEHRTLFHSFFLSRALSENSAWEVYVRHCLRIEKIGTMTYPDHWIMIGIQTRGMLQPVQDY